MREREKERGDFDYSLQRFEVRHVSEYFVAYPINPIVCQISAQWQRKHNRPASSVRIEAFIYFLL